MLTSRIPTSLSLKGRQDDRRETDHGGVDQQALGLRSEVVVQERLVHAHAIGDLLHARAVDAAQDEDPVGGVEDAGLGLRLGLRQ